MSFNKYETIFEKDIKDLGSKAYLLKHKKTGARVFILSNDDNNKVFYIGFRTPPSDDTGVAHIMEHSVLCGSEKYPLKDPFVELVKGSMNTFLNAMTYPDKTVYPVASTNDKDFANLMSVYMDAVFKPNVYIHPEIMKQEGWNYSINDVNAPIEYNGVVYNEMKGAFSSPESVLERETLHALFPDNAYSYESGGDPEFIPDLTYEKFIDFHKKYYHPSNSFIYLYGDMDVEERLEWMDQEYLSKYDFLEIDSEIKSQPAFDEMKVVKHTYAISEEESETENTYLSYNIHCGDNLDPYKYYAMQMLQYALVDTQGAPIRQKLLDAGIGKDIISGFETGLKQEYFSVTAKNADPDQADKFLEIINEELRAAANGKLNHRSLTASLNSLEFKYKEADFGGYPKGLIYGLGAFDSWLYDENEPLMHIVSSETFAFLRNNIDSGYYEELIKTWLADSKNSALIVLKPKKGLAAKRDELLAQKLKEYKDSKTAEEIAQMVSDTKALAEYQEAEDTEEQKRLIPLLERSDIRRKATPFSNIEDAADGITVIHHDYNTNGIAYVSLFFDANMLSVEELPYLSLLKSVVSFVDTDRYTYSELNDEVNIETGGLGMDLGIYTDRYDFNVYSVLADMSFRALYGNVHKAFELVKEILFAAHYDDSKRLYEIIAELKSKLQMSINSAGHVAAAVRAGSYYSESEAIKEIVNGIQFYKFVEHLEKNFDTEKDKCISGIITVLNKILKAENVLISCTADKEGYGLVKNEIESFSRDIRAYEDKNVSDADVVPTMAGNENPIPYGIEYSQSSLPVKDRKYKPDRAVVNKKNEGFKTSSSVQYVARTGKYIDSAAEYNGSSKVFNTIMRYEYLWFNIRVQGGAYGCMCDTRSNGLCSFVSYRDPNLKRTNEVYEGISAFLEEFDVDEREMTKYVIGTMSSIDMPLSPVARGSRDMGAYLTGVKFEDSQKAREEIIDCTAEDIRRLAPHIKKALEMNNLCVVGSESKIEEDRDLFMTVENMFE